MALANYLLPFFFFLLSLLLLASNFLSISKTNLRKNRQLALPPSPKKLPILGNLLQLGHLPHRSLAKLSQKHGPLMYLELGSIPTIIVSSAETAKAFLRTHDLDCCSRPFITSGSKLSYNREDIAFAPYGPQWRELRKLCISQFFSTKKVAHFQSTRQEEVDRMIESIASSSSSSPSVVNLSAMLLSLSNNITCRTALGKRYEYGRLIEMFDESEAMLGGFFIGDYIPELGFLDVVTGMRGRLEKNFKELDEFYERIIDEHVEAARLGEEGEDIVDVLLRIQKDDPLLTKEHIKAAVMNIFIGGTDTSSSALEWAMSELMRYPQAMREAQDEVRNLIKTKGKVLVSDLQNLPYMKCVIKEALRLHPPVPLLVFRETINQFQVHGFDIPAKARLIVNAWAIGRAESYWEDPDEFNPKRFADGSIDFKGHDFEYIPFGAGRRICPGMHAGIAVVELALANLLYSFDWELSTEMLFKGDIDMDEAIGASVHRKTALHLVATKYRG